MENIIKALVKASKDFREPRKNKTAGEKGSKFSYSYTDLDEVVRATKPALTENGLFIYQTPITRIDEKEGQMMGMKTIIFHESGESIEAEYEIKTVKTSPQDLGSVITYLRRYQYMSVLGLAPTEDDLTLRIRNQR